MSSMEIFHILKNIFLALGIILFVAAVVEFFAFNIKKIFQDLSGITRKREIRQMTEDTEYTGHLKRRSAGARHEKMMTPSGRLSSASTGYTTGKLRNPKKKAVITPPPKEEREVVNDTGKNYISEANSSSGLSNAAQQASDLNVKNSSVNSDLYSAQSEENGTAVLNETETSILSQSVIEENEREGETSVLAENSAPKHREIHFLLERQILMTHTNEVIE